MLKKCGMVFFVQPRCFPWVLSGKNHPGSLKRGHVWHTRPYFTGNPFIVWHARDYLKEQNEEQCALWHISVFFFQKNWRCYHFGLSFLIVTDAHTGLPLKIRQDEGRTALPAFVLFYLLWRKQTLFIVFLFWGTVLSLLWSLAVSGAGSPLNGAALPSFWQLNLPYFLVILAPCEVLTLGAKGACGQHLCRKSQYRRVSLRCDPLSFQRPEHPFPGYFSWPARGGLCWILPTSFLRSSQLVSQT